ncbi:MAG: hypothetical protein HQK53_07155, partial [Oligoflexia bacterium]|nr:hypothetical protein [Oligoflexia bacterium]
GLYRTFEVIAQKVNIQPTPQTCGLVYNTYYARTDADGVINLANSNITNLLPIAYFHRATGMRVDVSNNNLINLVPLTKLISSARIDISNALSYYAGSGYLWTMNQNAQTYLKNKTHNTLRFDNEPAHTTDAILYRGPEPMMMNFNRWVLKSGEKKLVINTCYNIWDLDI